MNGLFVLSLVLLILWIGYLTRELKRTQNLFEKLSQIKSDNLSEILKRILKSQEASKNEFSEIYSEIARIDKEKMQHIQNVSVLSYDILDENRVDKGWSAAMLDHYGSGIVYTILQIGNSTKSFVKEVVRGRGNSELTQEEKKVIKKALELRLLK